MLIYQKHEQKILKNLGATLIDHEFYQISRDTAMELCAGSLPLYGYERRVEIESIYWWVARTTVEGKEVWSIRVA